MNLLYGEFSKCAIGLSYYLRIEGLLRMGILAPNTPGFLIAVYRISSASSINIGIYHSIKFYNKGYIILIILLSAQQLIIA